MNFVLETVDKVVFMHCGCKAGTQNCKHCGAALYKASEFASATKDISVTSRKNRWKVPSLNVAFEDKVTIAEDIRESTNKPIVSLLCAEAEKAFNDINYVSASSRVLMSVQSSIIKKNSKGKKKSTSAVKKQYRRWKKANKSKKEGNNANVMQIE